MYPTRSTSFYLFIHCWIAKFKNDHKVYKNQVLFCDIDLRSWGCGDGARRKRNRPESTRVSGIKIALNM